MDDTSSCLKLSPDKLLSSERLFSHRKPGDKSLPKAGGKDVAPDGSWLHGRRVDQFHQEWKTVISEERVEKLGNLVSGIWNPDRGLIEFEKEQGKFWAHMGFVDDQRKWLYPEEALYLMETSVLEVKYGDIPLSIQQGYSTLLGVSVTLDEYQVYAHMRRLGFVVIRHRARSGTTGYERRIRMDQHLPHGSRKRKHKHGHSDQHVTEDKHELGQSHQHATKEIRADEMETSSSLPEHDIELKAEKSGETSNEETDQSSVKKIKFINSQTKLPQSILIKEEDNSEKVPTISLCGPGIDYMRNMPVIQSKHVDFSSIDVPNLADVKEKITLKAPVSGLLPENVIFPHDECELDIASLHLNSTANKHRKGDWTRDQHPFDILPSNFSFPKYFMDVRREIKAKSWKEYKAERSRIESERSVLEDSPVSHLWSGEVQPLIRPQDALSTGNLLNKLQVIQELKMKPSESENHDEDELKVAYDIYQPGKTFKKSRPGIPHYRVTIQSSCIDPPSLGTLTRVMNRYNDDVPLIWAVVGCGEMTFYTFSDVSLPVDINMG